MICEKVWCFVEFQFSNTVAARAVCCISTEYVRDSTVMLAPVTDIPCCEAFLTVFEIFKQWVISFSPSDLFSLHICSIGLTKYIILSNRKYNSFGEHSLIG